MGSHPPLCRKTTPRSSTNTYQAALPGPNGWAYAAGMDATAARLRSVLQEWTPRLEQIDDTSSAPGPESGGWSPKELVGHLIDSASVNLERFLRAEDSDHLDLPGYPQDRWVDLGGYAEADWGELVTLWRLLNLQVARVIEGSSETARSMVRRAHRLDAIAFNVVPVDQPTTLQYLMDDYVVHLEHHLRALEP